MLRKSNKNSGMSLIEVIVSMLVLSIAVVAVTMSFSTASKINMGTKSKQMVDALMENLVEYAEAGGTSYELWFPATSVDPVTDGLEPGQEKNIYKGIYQGLYAYDVSVLVDREPNEYENDKLNNYEVIRFGSSSSKTLMIDASLKSYDASSEDFGLNVSDYDEEAYKFFSNMHTSVVLEHNIIDSQEELADPDGHAEDPWDLTELADIPNFVDRELRLVVSTPVAGKMQLTAYLTYILDTSIKLPAGVSNVRERTLFDSEMYDVPSAPGADPNNVLSQVYIMYSPAALEPAGYGLGYDIRVMDAAHVMDANIFIANQQTSLMNMTAAIGKAEIKDLDETTHEVKVSFKNPAPTSSENFEPAGGDIYCSGSVSLQDEAWFPNTEAIPNKLIAKGEEVRIITTTLEIMEAGTNKVLASKKVTHLQ